MSTKENPWHELFVDSFRAIQVDVHSNAKDKGWWAGERNDGECIALMHSELSEALESLRLGPSIPDDKINRPGVEVELADCIIRIMDFAAARGLDVAGAIVEKHAYNQTRSHRHGGKRF